MTKEAAAAAAATTTNNSITRHLSTVLPATHPLIRVSFHSLVPSITNTIASTAANESGPTQNTKHADTARTLQSPRCCTESPLPMKT